MNVQSLPIPLMIVGGVLIFKLLLVILLISFLRSRASRNRMQRLHEMDSLKQAMAESEARQRDECLRMLRQLNESLVSTFMGVGQAQAEQMSTLIRQSHESAQAFDMHQQRMQHITEESLKRIEARMQSTEAQTARLLSQNDARMETLRAAMDKGMKAMRDENAQKLTEIQKTVDEKLNDTLERRLNASFSQVSERLEQVYRSLGEMHSLASGVGDLKRMLGNVKTRGVWGEIQLGALLEQALTDTQYQRNVAVVPRSSERVEFAVCLPGREAGGTPVYLPIDSKFPQEDYARLAEAADNADQPAVEAAQKALMNAVRTEAKRIGKYIFPPNTTDFAVMFLPLEGLYAEVMRHSSLVESIQREQRILIAGPSTLLALLNSLQMGFRTLAIEQRSAEVWKLLGAVKNDFGSFTLLLQKTQEKLRQATDSIDTAFVKTRGIERRLRRVEAVESGENENDNSPKLPPLD